MIDAMEMLDDVAFAKAMLSKKALSGADLVFSLRNLLRMKYYPVAVKFFFSQEELDSFNKNSEYKVSAHPFTFCHYLAASRQRGDILLSPQKGLITPPQSTCPAMTALPVSPGLAPSAYQAT